MYPFVFTVDFGKYTESFRYGQFFEKGRRGGESMKKRRRLRKPIRWALRFVCYAVAAIVADLTVIGAILYYFGDMYIMAALGVCLGVNILTEYFFFKDEFRRKVVKE